MQWFNSYRTPLIAVGSFFYVRVRQSYVLLLVIATVVLAHTDKLHFGEFWNDLIVLVCLIILALNHSVVEKK